MDRLEDIIRKKSLRAKPYEPKPDWDRMAALLDQEDDKPVGVIWWENAKYLAAVVLILVLGSAIWWKLSDDKQDPAPQGEMVEENPSIQQPLQVPADPAQDSPSSFKSEEFPATTQKIEEWTSEQAKQPQGSQSTSIPTPPALSTYSGFVEEGRQRSKDLIAQVESSMTQGENYAINKIQSQQLSLLSYDILNQTPDRVRGKVEDQQEKTLDKVEDAVPSPKPKKERRQVAQERLTLKDYRLQAGMTSTHFSLDVLTDSSIQVVPIVMAGVGLELDRYLTDRWMVGVRADIGSFEKFSEVSAGRYNLPYASTSNRSYLSIRGNEVDLSTQLKFMIRKERTHRFQPYLIYGMGFRLSYSSIYGVNSVPFAEQVSLEGNFVSSLSEDLSNERQSSAYLTNYQNSLFSFNKSSVEEEYAAIGRTNRFIRAMIYPGFGLDLRLYRRVCLSYQMTVHLSRNSTSIEDQWQSAQYENGFFQDQDPLNSPSPPIADQQSFRENWTPPFLRQSLGIKVAF